MLLENGSVRRVSGRKAMSLVVQRRAIAGEAADPAVLPAAEPGLVRLAVMLGGVWLPLADFPVKAAGAGASLDARLRELFSGLVAPRASLAERSEHVALLAQWYYGAWRDAEWRPFGLAEEIPYRALVRDISRAAARAQGRLPGM